MEKIKLINSLYKSSNPQQKRKRGGKAPTNNMIDGIGKKKREIQKRENPRKHEKEKLQMIYNKHNSN